MLSSVVLLLVGAMSACSSTVAGRFCPERQLSFSTAETPPWWTISAGDDTLLIAYVDESGDRPYEEIALQLAPAGLTVGTHDLKTVLRQGYYQRGGRVRTYVSRSLTGELAVTRSDAEAIEAKLTLTALDPTVDVQAQGTVGRSVALSLKKGDASFCR